MERISRPSACISSWLRPLAGSSSRTKRGRDTSARASSTLFCTANGKAGDRGVAQPFEAQHLQHVFGALVRKLLFPHHLRQPEQSSRSELLFIKTCWPTSRFSSTVIVGKSARFWKVREMPGPDDLVGRHLQQILPLEDDRALVGS